MLAALDCRASLAMTVRASAQSLILARIRGLGHFSVSRTNKINGLIQKVFTTRSFFGGGPARRPIDSGKPGNSRFLRASKTNESVARDA